MGSLLEEAALGVDEALDRLTALDLQLPLLLMDQIQVPVQLDLQFCDVPQLALNVLSKFLLQQSNPSGVHLRSPPIISLSEINSQIRSSI